MKNIMFAALVAMFAVSANAADAAKTSTTTTTTAPAAPSTKEACDTAKGTWDAKTNVCTPAAPAKK